MSGLNERGRRSAGSASLEVGRLAGKKLEPGLLRARALNDLFVCRLATVETSPVGLKRRAEP